MPIYFWIALGSVLGGVGRYWFSGLVARSGLVASHFGETFPWGTLFVNVAGSLLIGLFATLTAPDGRLLVGPGGRQFVMLGSALSAWRRSRGTRRAWASV
ncbi:MAG: hypothetical protein GY944_04445 [bacterium]|nr:hypothetical protein [bacterium]